MDEIFGAIRHFILREFLAGDDPDELTEATPLITGFARSMTFVYKLPSAVVFNEGAIHSWYFSLPPTMW